MKNLGRIGSKEEDHGCGVRQESAGKGKGEPLQNNGDTKNVSWNGSNGSKTSIEDRDAGNENEGR